MAAPPLPNFDKGIDYWTNVDATVDGVLGGYGTGPLPRVEQLGSRLFLLSLFPHLQTFDSPITTPAILDSVSQRFVALDVGAGVGRVTAEVLLPLVDDVVTIEPVKHFIEEARRSSSSWRFLNNQHEAPEKTRTRKARTVTNSLGNDSNGKRVWFIKGALNDLDPERPLAGKDTQSLGVMGGAGSDGEFGERAPGIWYDVIWCQWCLGHLSNPALVSFLKRARRSLKPDPSIPSDLSNRPDYTPPRPLIIVKENVCDDLNGAPQEVLDPDDSSLTRSNLKWQQIFKEAGLTIVKEEVQLGLPSELYVVKMWAVR